MSPFLAPLTLALLIGAPETPGHWYQRDNCKDALASVLSADLEVADRKIKALEGASDLEDQACGVWLRANMAETQIAVGGRLPALLDNRERVLLRMYKFARAYGGKAQHLADLEIESRMRRIRSLVDRGERSEALKETNRTKDLLKQRGTAADTPTQQYVSGVMNTAVSEAGLPMKIVLGLAGVSGDAKEGRRHLKSLAEGGSVYRYDAMYILHHFSRENPSAENGRPFEYSQKLRDLFPTNPQFIYDLAVDLREEKRCKESLSSLEEVRKQLETQPDKWSSMVRAKLYYINGRCSMDVGDKPTAKKYAALAKAQGYEDLESDIDDLISETQGS